MGPIALNTSEELINETGDQTISGVTSVRNSMIVQKQNQKPKKSLKHKIEHILNNKGQSQCDTSMISKFGMSNYNLKINSPNSRLSE